MRFRLLIISIVMIVPAVGIADTIMINLAGDNCPQYVREQTSGGNNKARCPYNSKLTSDGVCKAAGGSIEWKMVGANPNDFTDPPFTIDVKSGHVLENCAWSGTGGNKKYTCDITSNPAQDSYSYSITTNAVNTADICVLDPRIIITNNVLVMPGSDPVTQPGNTKPGKMSP
jgi:hypothetical protein